MSMIHDFRYDLRIYDADERALAQFAYVFASTKFADCMQQDPNDPEMFSTEVTGRAGALREETIEEQLHELSTQFPNLKLHFVAEDLDRGEEGYELFLHGNNYRRSDYYIAKSNFSPPMPFEDRHKVLPSSSNLQIDLQSTKDLVMSLYANLYEAREKDPRAYHIANNLAYLSSQANSEEIPLDSLYRISERLWDVNWSQPLLNEERLDAVRLLLEEGYGFISYHVYPPCEILITEQEMPQFLPNCSEDSFVYLIEESAYDNQIRYGRDPTSELTEQEVEAIKGLSKEVIQFHKEQETLSNKIAEATQRALSMQDNRGTENQR